MSGITSRGRRGSTIVPNWRWEDPDLDPYELRIAGWLASHADSWCEDHVTRNAIARATRISAGKVTMAMQRLAALGIVEVSTVEIPLAQGGQRWEVVFDHSVWEGPRSSDDQAPVTARPGPGHDMTASRGHQEEEQEEDHSRAAADAEFELFWVTYGRVGPKKIARQCWDRALKKATADEIMVGLDSWVAYWQKPGAASVKWPQGWLNEERWKDEPPPIRGRAHAQSRVSQNAAILQRMRERS